MINLPKLDDQNYKDIVEAAKRRIPVIFPEWTDYNEHDIGITIIELFAWLKEMQQYKLDRIPNSVREAMLLLAGAKPQLPTPARVKLITPQRLCAGSTAKAADGTLFTLLKPFDGCAFEIENVFMYSAEGFVDVTGISADAAVPFYPFGAELECGERFLYIKISKPQDKLTFEFMTEDRCPVARNPYNTAEGAPRNIVWEYSAASGFKRCAVECDETHGLSFSGGLTLSAGADFAEIAQGVPAAGVWLRASVENGGCEDMPLLSGIYASAAEFVQMQRESAYKDALLTDGAVEIEDILAANGQRMVMLRDEYGWFDIPDPECTVSGGHVRYDLSEYESAVSADGQPNVRVVFCTEQAGERILFSSDGLPCAEFPFDFEQTLLCDELKIMVKDRESAKYPRWREYAYIEDLALAGEQDRVFTYDEKRGMIAFGDNENGEAPPAGNDNILVISCALTKGDAGNIAADSLNEINTAIGAASSKQPFAAQGGRSRESFDAALRRFRYELSDCKRAVSAEDYRAIAMKTPGLRVADVRAIPAFDPDEPYAPPEKQGALMTLAVLPYSRRERPVPDDNFLAAVREHMEQGRLLTVELKTCAPLYVTVNVSAELVCSTNEITGVLKNAERLVRQQFGIYPEGGKSRFGESVREADLIAKLCNAEGVLTVKNLKISADRPECKRTAAGITIPPHAIACCGKVEFVSV